MALLPIGLTTSLSERAAWYRLVLALHDRLIRRAPVAGLHLTRLFGLAASRLGVYGPRPEELSVLFPDCQALGRVAGQITACDLLGRAYDRLLLGGCWETASRLVDTAPAARALREAAPDGTPVIVAVLHGGGAVSAVSMALHRAGIQATIMRSTSAAARPGSLEVVETGVDGSQGALALRRAIDCLRARRSVVVALDGVGTTTPPVACLGRRISFRRGAFVLSRLAGLPIVPVVSRWRAGPVPIEVRAFAPVAPPAPGCDPISAEREQAAAVAAWLEGRLRRHPEELPLPLLPLLEPPAVRPGNAPGEGEARAGDRAP